MRNVIAARSRIRPQSRLWNLLCVLLAGAIVSGTLGGGAVFAEEQRAKSPPGTSSGVLLGKWLDVSYSRPLLRGRRQIFGAGAEYGKDVNAGAPVWRAGANQTTRFKTEIPLTIAGKKIPAGTYDVFVELKESGWTFILSTQPVLEKYDPKNKNKEMLWGSYGYDPKFDVVRAPMTMGKSEPTIEQFTIGFVDMGDKVGSLQLAWDHTTATVEFTAAAPGATTPPAK